MSKLKPASVERVLQAAHYSWQGLRAAWKYERAFRDEVIVLIILAPIAWAVGDNAFERILLIGSWLGVLIIELVNSSIEAVVDRASPEHNELAGRAKDLGSAAVFMAMVLSALIWVALLV